MTSGREALPFRDAEQAGDFARAHGLNLRLQLDVSPDYPWPLHDRAEVSPEQIAAWEAEQAAKAAPAAA